MISEPAIIDAHSKASGILSLEPVAVAVPRDADEVSSLVRWAAGHRLPLVPRGAGTGMPGGNVGTAVAVDLASHFRDAGDVDRATRSIAVEPGVTLAELNAAARHAGLHFPVDPSSGDRCTLGGMIANNSAGAHSVLYGATRQWVRAIDVVLADGAPVRLRRGGPDEAPALRPILDRVRAALEPHRGFIETRWPKVRKNSSGYALREFLRSGDAIDLLIGSEGTLGIITAAELKLEAMPAASGLLLLEFDDLDAAGAAVLALVPERPATCELLDRTFLDLVRHAGADHAYPLRDGLNAILLVEALGDTPAEAAAALERLAVAAAPFSSGATRATSPERQARLWELRHAASPLIAAQAGRRVSMQFIEDSVVPLEALPQYIRFLRATLQRHQLPAVIFGHAGDGNLHVNPLVDVRVANWRDTLNSVLAEVADEVARLGGTLAGEHGDGRLRAPLLETIWGAEMMTLFRAVKDAFDPHGIFNPGVILPLPGQRPLDALRRFG